MSSKKLKKSLLSLKRRNKDDEIVMMKDELEIFETYDENGEIKK